ncbi:unnamed protein product [Caenorhabditis sp. 36 PRJEB53466]|nr:unnamed protein product [Caenorhabditis sp. 36 PRJEB53466]
MFHVLFLYFCVETVATQIFSETIGKVIIKQNACSVMPSRIWKRFNQHGPKPLGEYPPETLKFLMTWVHSAHGVESQLENMLLKWEEQSICFKNATTMSLKKVAHGGEFSREMQTFSYLEVPEFWAARDEDDLNTWRNLNVDECTSTDEVTYRCPESAFKDSCTQKDLDKCSERIEMDSSEHLFTFTRRLANSHLIATRVRRGSVIRNGNIFDIKPVELPERIFKITLAATDMMSIGGVLLKN